MGGGGGGAVVLGMSRFKGKSMKRSAGWLNFSWRKNEGRKEGTNAKAFPTNCKNSSITKLRNIKLFLSAF